MHDDDKPLLIHREQGLASSQATLDFAQEVHERAVFLLFDLVDDVDGEGGVILVTVVEDNSEGDLLARRDTNVGVGKDDCTLVSFGTSDNEIASSFLTSDAEADAEKLRDNWSDATILGESVGC